MKYFLELAYKGTVYHGWQKQHNALTVQEKLEKSLSTILKEEIETLGSGRTDTGVHASQQFVEFCSETEINSFKYILHLNSVLPHDIVAKKFYAVPEVASARYDAYSRSYEYRILNHRDPFLYGLVWFLHWKLDVVKMNQVAQELLKHQDFECFSRVKTDVTSFECTITRAEWVMGDNGLLVFHISANRFLRGMVRAIVGTLVQVGLGKLTHVDFVHILKSNDRKKASASAPAEGLFLTKVEYPDGLMKAV